METFERNGIKLTILNKASDYSCFINFEKNDLKVENVKAGVVMITNKPGQLFLSFDINGKRVNLCICNKNKEEDNFYVTEEDVLMNRAIPDYLEKIGIVNVGNFTTNHWRNWED